MTEFKHYIVGSVKKDGSPGVYYNLEECVQGFMEELAEILPTGSCHKIYIRHKPIFAKEQRFDEGKMVYKMLMRIALTDSQQNESHENMVLERFNELVKQIHGDE